MITIRIIMYSELNNAIFNKRFVNWKRKKNRKQRFDSIATEGLKCMKQCFIQLYLDT